MHIFPISDIHLEFACGSDEKLDKMIERLDSWPTAHMREIVMVVAGDLSKAKHHKSLVKFFDHFGGKFKHIVYVLGNHEYWGDCLEWSVDRVREAIAASRHKDKITLLNNGVKVLDGVAFIGSTLWTDFAGGDPLVKGLVGQQMNDYHKIRSAGRAYKKLKPYEIELENKIAVEFLENMLNTLEHDGKRVVVTHHSPSIQLVTEALRSNGQRVDPHIDWAYGSRLEERLILDVKHPADLWIHGHTHNSIDQMIGYTRVVCNPYGYENEWNKNYNSRLIIAI